MIKKGQKGASRKGGLYTPRGKQNHVIAASLAGKNHSEISKEVGIKRDTVARILSQPDVQELLAQYRQQARGLVPLCLAGLEAKLITKAGKLRRSIDWRMLVEILKGTQVLVPKQEEEVTTKDEFAGRSREIFNSSSNTEDIGRRNLLRLTRATQRHKELDEIERCRTDPLYWLQTWTQTFDERWKEKGSQSPYRPFPKLPYFPWLFQIFSLSAGCLFRKAET